MALTTGTTIYEFGDWTQLEASGASVSAGAVSAAATTECTPTQHEKAMLIEFGISAEFGANTPTEGNSVDLYAKVNDIGAASQDGNVPISTHLHKYLGSGVLKAVAGTQYLQIGPVSLPAENFDCYLVNGDDTDAMTWKLWVRPWGADTK